MNLITMKKGIEGLIALSPNLEIMIQSICNGKVPDIWLKSNIITRYYEDMEGMTF